MFVQSDIKAYFTGQRQGGHASASRHFADKVVTGVDILIHMGEVGVSRQQKTVEELMDHVKLTDEEL